MVSKLFFSLSAIKSQKSYSAGTLVNVTSDEAAGFINISFSTLKLLKGGALEPIWHPNANKIGYCLQGSCIVTLRTPTSVETFTLKKGDVFFIPKGYVHNIVNNGNGECSICFSYNHTTPETMCLSNAMLSLSESVFTATFNMNADFYEGLKKIKQRDLITAIPQNSKMPQEISSHYKFNIAASNKPILTKGGYLQLATKTNLPILDGLGILGFGLNRKGVVEPHWHTNAGELVYIVKGHTRITVLSPDNHVEVMEVKGGEGAFAPASHFHNIENIGEEDVEVIAFFSHAEPDYMGLGEVIGSFTNEVLAGVFNVKESYFEALKKTQQPLVIVPV